MAQGGKRAGAGRKKGSGLFGEPTAVMRVPQSRVDDVKQFLRTRGQTLTLGPRTLRERQPQEAVIPSVSSAAVLSFPAPEPKVREFTLFEARVAAGFPSPADESAQRGIDLNEHLVKNAPATFFVRAEGESMLGAGIHPGDLLVVDRSLKASHGKIVIAAVNGELTVKRLHQKNGETLLLPENPAFRPIPITDETGFTVWGVVTNVVHSV